MEKNCECVKCGWKWLKRTEKPLQCPKCTARHWWDKERHRVFESKAIYNKQDKKEEDIF